jgi:hypothetical protein
VATREEDGWKPRLAPNVDYSAVTLTPEDAFVLSRVDGATHVANLVHLTGLERSQLDVVLQRLAASGVLLPPPSLAPAPVALPEVRAPVVEAEPVVPQPVTEEPVAAEGEGAGEAATAEEQQALQVEEGNYRKLYETVLRPLSKDQRLALATTETGPGLLALCLDADPQVISAVLDNATVGPPHARLIAFHHKNPLGLDALGRKSQLFTNRDVQRLLLANDQLGEGLFHKVMDRRRLKEMFRSATDRNVPEKTRVRARGLLRGRFTSRDPDERAELILSTEGRVLNMLTGIVLDSQTASAFTVRPIMSSLLVQNLARFPGTPAILILHLLKQPLVQRTQHLRQALVQHPNTPSDVKRRGGV